jgi:tetratricopeptide (TPR) repeat protein
VRRIWGFKLWAADRVKESEQVFREALAIFEKLTTDPSHDGESLHLAADTLRLIAELELRRGDSKQAEASLRKAIDLHEGRATDFADLKVARHDQAFPYLQLALLLVQSGQPQEARSLTDRALDIDPANHWLWYLGARLYLAAGDVENYRRACGEMLDRFSQAAEAQPEIAERIAKTCALAPGAVSDFSRVEKLADRAVAGTQQHGYYRNFLLAKGLVEYRAGRHAEAIEWLARFAPKADGQHWDATGSSTLAMAHHGLGHADQARAALTAAQAIIDQNMQSAANGRPVPAFDFDWLHARILYQEAEKLLNEKDES